MRSELTSLVREDEELEFKFYEAGDDMVDAFGVNAFPTIMLVNGDGQEVVRFEPASDANLRLVIEELQK